VQNLDIAVKKGYNMLVYERNRRFYRRNNQYIYETAALEGGFFMEAKKNLLTREGLKKYEDELHDLKVVKRKEVAQKIKEAREQGDLSENAEYDAAKDEQRDIEARIEELEKILKNVEVVDMDDDENNLDHVGFGLVVKVKDNEFDDEMEFKIVGATEANSLKGKISNESPLGKALLGAKKGDIVTVEAPAGVIEYTILDIYRPEA
jgi:transcription elongation factor GreA